MTKVSSFRLYCEDCSNETVVRKGEEDETLWKVISMYFNEGLCPECNDAISTDEIDEARETYEDDDEPVPFEEIDGVGAATSKALRRAGVSTKGDVRRASDAKLQKVKGLGQSKVDGIRQYIARPA